MNDMQRRRTPIGRRSLVSVLVLCVAVSTQLSARPVALEEVAKIVTPDPSDALVGRVALSGGHLLVATRHTYTQGAELLSDQRVRAYQRTSGNTWAHTDLLFSATTSFREHLVSIAINGDVAAVYLRDLMVFERVGTAWVHTATLPVGDTGPYDVEIDGVTILVGGDLCFWQAFRKVSGVWRSVGSSGQHIACSGGADVDMSGSVIAVANPPFAPPGEDVGEVRLFYGVESTQHDALVLDPDPADGFDFGHPIALGGATLFAGHTQSIAAFERNASGAWARVATLQVPDAASLDIPITMDAQRGNVVVGYPSDSLRWMGGGSARVFRRESASSYPEIARLYASDAFGQDHLSTLQLGVDVDVDDGLVAATARHAAYIFRLPTQQAPNLIQDDFQDGSATDWSPSLNSWSVVAAGGSRVYRQTNLTALNVRSIWNTTVQPNQAIEVDATPTQFATADRWFGVIVRYTDPSNYYYLSVRNTGQVLLRRRQNGVFTTIDSAPLPVSTNATYRLRIEAIGTRIRGYVDGDLLVEAVDRELAAGKPGLITYGAQVNFDNVVVTPSHLTPLLVDDFESQFLHPGWRVASGTWVHEIDFGVQPPATFGRYLQTSPYGRARVFGGADTVDQVVSTIASAPDPLRTTAWYGPLARYKDDGNFYYLRISHNRVSLRKQVNGDVFELDGAAFTHQPGVRYAVRIEALGPVLRGYVNGRLLLEARDETHKTGKYGLGTFDTPATFEEFSAVEP